MINAAIESVIDGEKILSSRCRARRTCLTMPSLTMKMMSLAVATATLLSMSQTWSVKVHLVPSGAAIPSIASWG